MQEGYFRLGLIGHPVQQSVSPVIHGTALRELRLSGVYTAIDVTDKQVAQWIAEMAGGGYRGVNVTIPHKQAVMNLLDSVSAEARSIGAVNTIVVENGRLHGHNTDHIGFLAPLNMAGHEPENAVMLGAGGSGRSVAYALSGLPSIKNLCICARSPERAFSAIDTVANGSLDVSVVGWDQRFEVLADSDLIVNTTPLGMWPHTSQSPLPGASFNDRQLVYDLIYNPRQTKLLGDAAAQGAGCIDGLPMLVGQAAASFKLWTGADMPLKSVTLAAEEALFP